MTSVFRVRTDITGGSGGAELGTLFFQDNGVLTAQNAATAAYTFWNSIKAYIHPSVSLQVEPLVTSVDVVTNQPVGGTSTTTSAVVGTGSTDPLPWATQGVLQLQTGVYIGGRELRGRLFLPGPGEGDNTLGVPVAGYKTAINTAAATLIADPNSELVIYSRTKHTFNRVNSGVVWNKWGYLSSRRD